MIYLNELEHASESTVRKKANELNALAGNDRFSVIPTQIPGKSSTLRDSWSILDKETGKRYVYGSIAGMAGLRALTAQLNKNRVDAVSQTSPKAKRSRYVLQHGEFVQIDDDDDSMEHYGVLGMKWGVRKDPQKAYKKANKKLAKLDAKVSASEKATKKTYEKSLKKRTKADSAFLLKKYKARKAASSINAVNRAHVKTQYRVMKAKKWYDAMENAFRDTKVSELNPQYEAIGKKYANIVLDDLMKNVGSDIDMRNLAAYYRTRSRGGK